MSHDPDARWIIVLAPQKTASSAVSTSLAELTGGPEFVLLCAHHMEPPQAAHPLHSAEVHEKKQRKLGKIRKALAHNDGRRILVTISRPYQDRLASLLWMKFGPQLTQIHRESGRLEHDVVRRLLRDTIKTRIGREATYERRVWAPLGLSTPAPGRHVTNTGIPVIALDYARLEEDFAALTTEIFGAPHPLLRANTPEEHGDPDAHRAFRAWCGKHLARLIARFSQDAPAG